MLSCVVNSRHTLHLASPATALPSLPRARRAKGTPRSLQSPLLLRCAPTETLLFLCPSCRYGVCLSQRGGYTPLPPTDRGTRVSYSFRINTCKSVSKQTTLTPFRMNTYEKKGGGWGVSISSTPQDWPGLKPGPTLGGRYAAEFSESRLVSVGGAEDVTVKREEGEEEAGEGDKRKFPSSYAEQRRNLFPFRSRPNRWFLVTRGWLLSDALSSRPADGTRGLRPRAGRRGGRWILREIKTVQHAVRFRIAVIQRRQAEERLAELEQAHVRVKHLRDVSALGVRAEHQTADARPVTELSAVEGRMRAGVLPKLDVWRINMVKPAAPVIPSNEDGALRPQPTLNDGIHLVHRPLHAGCHVANQRVAAPVGRVRGMLAGVMGSVETRDSGKIRCGCILYKLAGTQARPPVEALDKIESIPAVVPPSPVHLVKTGRQRRQTEQRATYRKPVPTRVINER